MNEWSQRHRQFGDVAALEKKLNPNHALPHGFEAIFRQGGRSVNPSRNEHSIAESCGVSGRGYWSGKRVQVVMHPAPAGTGICFVRTDLPGSPVCHVAPEFRHDAQLRTNLRCGEAAFQMIEHLLAALFALEIDNCLVEIDGEELPGLDGSCKAYVDALTSAGLTIQAKRRERLVIDRAIRVESGDRWIEALPAYNHECYFEYRLSFDGPSDIPDQTFGFMLDARQFASQVAPARTFVTAQQAAHLRAQGVAAHVTNQDLLVYGESGPLDNTLRFDDECARHKTLDMIGDLAITGIELIGRFVSYRGGHTLNGRLTTLLHQLAQQTKEHTKAANSNSQMIHNKKKGRAA